MATATKSEPKAKSKSQFDDALQEKLDAFAEQHDTTSDKVVALAVSEWLADYDRGRWPHSHSALEPNPTLA